MHQQPGIHAHQAASLAPEDVTVIDGIPCTTLSRTLIDLADVVSRRAVVLALDQAELARIFDLRDLDAALARAAGRPGAAVVRSILAEYRGPLERKPFVKAFLALCERAGLRAAEPEVEIMLETAAASTTALAPWTRIATATSSCC